MQTCPECGAAWPEGTTCQDIFHELLGWETENMSQLGEVHHLTVLCYHLQHPSLYSPEGLSGARQLLLEFVERGASPSEMWQRNRPRLDSTQRKWCIRRWWPTTGPAVETAATKAQNPPSRVGTVPICAAAKIPGCAQRKWKVTARPGRHGAYESPIRWSMTVADVVGGGRDLYCDNVRAWARATLEALKLSADSGAGLLEKFPDGHTAGARRGTAPSLRNRPLREAERKPP